MLSVMGAVHEFERALIKERQLEGIALAKKRGAFKGRHKSLSQAEVAELRQRIARGMRHLKNYLCNPQLESNLRMSWRACG